MPCNQASSPPSSGNQTSWKARRSGGGGGGEGEGDLYEIRGIVMNLKNLVDNNSRFLKARLYRLGSRKIVENAKKKKHQCYESPIAQTDCGRFFFFYSSYLHLSHYLTISMTFVLLKMICLLMTNNQICHLL